MEEGAHREICGPVLMPPEVLPGDLFPGSNALLVILDGWRSSKMRSPMRRVNWSTVMASAYHAEMSCNMDKANQVGSWSELVGVGWQVVSVVKTQA